MSQYVRKKQPSGFVDDWCLVCLFVYLQNTECLNSKKQLNLYKCFNWSLVKLFTRITGWISVSASNYHEFLIWIYQLIIKESGMFNSKRCIKPFVLLDSVATVHLWKCRVKAGTIFQLSLLLAPWSAGSPISMPYVGTVTIMMNDTRVCLYNVALLFGPGQGILENW